MKKTLILLIIACFFTQSIGISYLSQAESRDALRPICAKQSCRTEIASNLDEMVTRFKKAVKTYQENIAIAEQAPVLTGLCGAIKAPFFFAYCQFVKTLIDILDPTNSVYIYPTPGPDISFQMYADTFILNKDPDSYLGIFLAEEAGVLEATDYYDYKKNAIYKRLLSKFKTLDAYNLKNYFDIERAENKTFILIMKGFMHIAEQHLDSDERRRDFLKNLLEHFLHVGNKVILFTGEDQDIFDSIAQIDTYYKLLYRNDKIFKKTHNAAIGNMKQVLIPSKIAIYEKKQEFPASSKTLSAQNILSQESISSLIDSAA